MNAKLIVYGEGELLVRMWRNEKVVYLQKKSLYNKGTNFEQIKLRYRKIGIN